MIERWLKQYADVFRFKRLSVRWLLKRRCQNVMFHAGGAVYMQTTLSKMLHEPRNNFTWYSTLQVRYFSMTFKKVKSITTIIKYRYNRSHWWKQDGERTRWISILLIIEPLQGILRCLFTYVYYVSGNISAEFKRRNVCHWMWSVLALSDVRFGKLATMNN